MAVPISWGSAQAATIEVGAMRVWDVRFPPDLCLAPHEHERPTLALVLAGGFQGAIAGREHTCAASTLRSEPAGERHSNRFGSDGAHVVVVQPKPDEGLPRPVARALAEVAHVRVPQVSVLGRAVATELRHGDDLSPMALEGLTLEILAVAARAFDRLADPGAPWLIRATALVHERFRDPLRLGAVAAELSISPSRLARGFRVKHGLGMAGYIRRLRLDWAASRLAHTSEPISAIAVEAGFADQPHFTRAFASYLGVTPRRFRELTRH